MGFFNVNNVVPIFLIAVLCSDGIWGLSFNIKVLRDEEREGKSLYKLCGVEMDF